MSSAVPARSLAVNVIEQLVDLCGTEEYFELRARRGQLSSPQSCACRNKCLLLDRQSTVSPAAVSGIM